MKKNKLGLALGSGGAKGLVHVGVLQALEEEKIEFDVLSGTSIGSVIAGMYALGYTAREMFGIFNEMGFGSFKWIFDSKIKRKPLNEILQNVIGEKDFSHLKKPYKAIATDVDSGEEVIIDKGDLCLAMAISCSIPPIFNAISYNGKRLIDGAFINSIPADVCKEMGAKYILGVDLSSDNPMNFSSLKILKNFYRKTGIKRCSRSYNGYRFADVIIAPDLTKYNLSSIKSSQELFDIGYDLIKNNITLIRQKLHLKIK